MEYRPIDYVWAWGMGTVVMVLILLWAGMTTWIALLASALFCGVCVVLLRLENDRAWNRLPSHRDEEEDVS